MTILTGAVESGGRRLLIVVLIVSRSAGGSAHQGTGVGGDPAPIRTPWAAK